MGAAEEYRQVIANGGYMLPDRAHFQITGADRQRYLNGQLTNAVEDLADDEARYALALDAKGKISCELFLSLATDSYHLDLPLDLRESAAARLERYMIADDVALQDVSDEYRLVHLVFASPAPDSLPEGATVLKANRLGVEGTDILIQSQDLEQVVEAVAASGLKEVSREVVDAIRIERGVAQWGVDFDDQTLPAEAGLEERAVSFTKGCYIGQEVVSRMHSVGSPSRRLCLLATAESEFPDWILGAKLFSLEDGEKQKGEITSVGYSFALDKPVALGYLKRGNNELGLPIRAISPDGGSSAVAEIIQPIK